MALPAGFVATDAKNAVSLSSNTTLRMASIQMDVLEGGDNPRHFWIEGSACPTTPIELRSRQRTKKVQYPGVDDLQVQILGMEYEPISLSGTVDSYQVQRKLANLRAKGDGFLTEIDMLGGKHAVGFTTPDLTDADMYPSDTYGFFDDLRKVQQTGYVVLLTVYLFDPKGITSTRAISETGASSTSSIAGTAGHYTTYIRCVITDVVTVDTVYGVTQYTITVQPVALANTDYQPSSIWSTKSALGRLKESQEAINDAVETIEDVIDTVNQYYNTYVHNSLAAIQQTMGKFAGIANGVLNIANLPAAAIQQVVALAYEVKTEAETLASNASAVGSNYKAIGNIDMEWDGPSLPDGDKAFAGDPEQAALQVNALRSGIVFCPDYDTTAEVVQGSSLSEATSSHDPTGIVDFDIRYDQMQRDRYIRNLLAPIFIQAKRIRDQYESLTGYTTYVCRYGDTLRLIAIKTYSDDSKWRDIADFNDLDGDELTEGQVILLPVL